MMLDTRARQLIEPLIQRVAKSLIRLNLSADQITYLALLTGLSTGFLIYFDYFIWAIILLWLSGLLDAVDGAVAREMNSVTPWGTLLDISFDRIVELSFIIGLALRFPAVQFNLLLMSGSIILSMTIFLTVGALAEKEGLKSFYYQAGLMERSEGFIFFTLMLLFTEGIFLISISYTLAVLFTALQRILEARSFWRS